MLYAEEGPSEAFKKLREYFGVEHDDEGPLLYPPGSVFACLGCLSVWVGLCMGLAPKWLQLGLASSALAILFERVKIGASLDADDALD